LANPYIDMQPGPAGIRLIQARMAWLMELQQWQLAAWRHAVLTSTGFVSLTWALPPQPQPPTVAERMASRSMWVIAGGKA
jgi:hypothetical protein